MNVMNFTIATQEKVVYQDDIFQVTLPTKSGEITVLPGHVPLISTISPGELRIKDKEGEHSFAISGGCVEIAENNRITILAHNIERATEIDIERAEEARKRAEEMLAEDKHVDNIDFARIQVMMEREFNRVRVGKKYRK